ncbi:PQQ-dependent sugar dehydrogenase [Methylobacillus gramineus]|uniref:PQQ-dependent sugar dehydrogenase n=1 Tax=Methylobacillus gramineus TaxID=755169 RepID=UPI001CFFC6D5|nr:PQQ-dependent sugar dehydrogenase [Methylobacillus gramineus]MCB5184756.1 PQQ-dependent sugar dehydrogenase [Methylobacillus gramineus]
MESLMPARLMLCLVASASLLACTTVAAVTKVPEDVAASLKLPAGFQISTFAKLNPASGNDVREPRFMTFGPDGHLYLASSGDNKVYMLPDRNHDGQADEIIVAAEGLNAPNSLVFAQGQMFISNQDGVVRAERKNGSGPVTKLTPIISGLPTGGHTLKTIKYGPDEHLYLNVGSSCNICTESDPLRATILRYTIDGKPAGSPDGSVSGARNAIWAQGLRNSQGMAWQPGTNDLYATNNGADMRSDTKGGAMNDELPPEHINHIEPGKHYGWPHCWGNRVTDPNFPGKPGFCSNIQPPAITLRAHSTPLGITFLDKAAFPGEYKSDAIVAMHGSWNRVQPYGYKLVRIKFKDNKPVAVEDFVTGWQTRNGAWGRPVDVVVGPDGALYVSDDRAGLVYRISYSKK